MNRDVAGPVPLRISTARIVVDGILVGVFGGRQKVVLFFPFRYYYYFFFSFSLKSDSLQIRDSRRGVWDMYSNHISNEEIW